MNADYWEKRTALIRDGAVRVLSLFRPEEVDYWRDELAQVGPMAALAVRSFKGGRRRGSILGGIVTGR
jgi:hypothetical protein